MNLNQFEIENLINCKKIIIVHPQKDMILEKGHLRNDMKLESEDKKYTFDVFMRQSNEFSENFSIGLVYNPRDEIGTTVLLRCNGPHGEHVNSMIESKHHCDFHVHFAKKLLL